MKHWRHILAASIAIAWTGCGSRPLPTSPSAGGDSSAARTSPATAAPQSPPETRSLPARSSQQSPPATATSPGVPAGPSASPADSKLRDLAARYLESNAAGAWRPNEKAATELEKLTAEQAAQLWPLLDDPQVEVRRGAAYFLLSRFNPDNASEVAAMTARLDDSDRTVRNVALAAVKQFNRSDEIAALPRLAAMLDPQREPSPDHRAAIARLCAGLKPESSQAIPALSNAATADPDAKVRAASLAAIGQVAAPEQAVPALAKGLADRDDGVRLVAAARLRQLGAASQGAAKELAAALADSDASVAQAAAEALIRIGEPAALPLAAQLASSSPAARKLALASLAKIGPAARSAIGAIQKCRNDSDPQIKQLAEAALARITSP